MTNGTGVPSIMTVGCRSADCRRGTRPVKARALYKDPSLEFDAIGELGLGPEAVE